MTDRANVSSSADFARLYHADGRVPIAFRAKTKGPRTNGWQNTRHTDVNLAAFNGSNVGVLTGEPSDGLHDVDLDCPEVIALVGVQPDLLPQTNARSGREGRPATHHWYTCQDSHETKQFLDPARPQNENMLVELRGTKVQTVVPPSIYPEGDRCVWHSTGKPTAIAWDDLYQHVSLLAACALLARHWPGKKSRTRHHASLALAGALLRTERFTPEEVGKVIAAIARTAGDEEHRKRGGNAKSTAEKLAKGETVTGLPTLKEMIDPRVVDKIAQWLDLGHVPDAASTVALEFKPFLPLDDPPRPSFPAETLSETLHEYVQALAESTQTPIDLSAMCVLGALATTRGGKTRVQVREDYEEPVNIYCMGVLPSGERKSAVFAAASAPLREIEKIKAASAAPEIECDQAAIRVLQKRIAQLEKEAAQEHEYGTTEGNALAEAFRLNVELAELQARARDYPRVIVDDCTPEKLAELMARNGERLSLWSPEGGELVEMMLGRYSANHRPNLGVFLAGHAGDSIVVDRKNGTRLRLDRPALSIAGTCQPGVLHDLRESPRLRERGLLARIVWCFPDSRLGGRRSDPAPLTREIRVAYVLLLRRLEGTELWDPPQRLLTLQAAALRVRVAFADEIEPQLATGGSLAGISDWAGKLPGLAMRLAGLLHEAEHAPDGPTAINADTMKRAVAIARWALAHALACFSEMEIEDDLAVARKIWRHIAKQGLGEVDEQALWQATKGGRVRTKSDLDGGVKRLAEHGYLKTCAGGGRKRYAVNPEAFDCQGH